MDHVAIMKKEWGLIPKILSGEKKLESRWYMNRCRPWGMISAGDIVYFKNSGESVVARAEVSKVIQLCDLNPEKVRKILRRYAQDDGLGIDPGNLESFYQRFEKKKYCMLIYLKNPVGIESFLIDKTGFGAMSAWITVPDIAKIRT